MKRKIVGGGVLAVWGSKGSICFSWGGGGVLPVVVGLTATVVVGFDGDCGGGF
uniref:Transmembrane protein n=1 Tax=Helianthus annuus TaxID=4232 RepID=A0A251STL2_HELAN